MLVLVRCGFGYNKKGHAKNDVKQQMPHIIVALKKSTTSLEGQWMLSPRPSSQAELSIIAIDENNEPQEHRIDLTFIDEDVRWIVDYKLTTTDENADLTLAAEQHKPQLVRYASLFSDENRPIKTAVFLLSIGKLVLV